ncbi:MAG: bifunctional alpha,alpha-trehalose-phosphate synthase (UDP-forming)/trehalose-phosphatase [Nitrospiraceae bacterium]|nr:MAG: bifunctional alpha,alpha-trehalose-phosphate synthase (UDP-forming)/trehalose-phosphatase [Nitrospiraceae bacterium]
MRRNRFRSIVDSVSGDQSLIIVSNREPYAHKKVGSKVKVEKPAGGLTSAMDEALKSIGGTWVAWGSGSEDRNHVGEKDRVQVPPKKPLYTLKRVWLSPDEVNNYYHGYSNHVLWPLCHMALDRVYFRKKYWEDYKRANRSFARAILEETGESSTVWIHDYHLCLVPEMLRSGTEKLSIAHFWHIPWPNFSVLRICPQSREILEALLHNDLIGFQIPLFIHNFMECVHESIEDADIDYESETVSYRGHTTKLKAFPISVDFERFHDLASSEKSTNAISKLMKRHSLPERKIGIGVDRLEYTKGLIKRFQALDLFFERHPEYMGKFTFIQIAVPTRMKEPYISYKATVEGLVRKINKKYSQEGWNPIIYRDTKSEHEDLAVYYRMGDLAIISSIYDGMNLVAKEFIASQVDEKGVLILSEFAGAAEELEGAMLVNPYDIEDFSDSIKRALDMTAEEKSCRIRTLRRQVRERDIYRWISDFIKDIGILKSKQAVKAKYLLNHLSDIPKEDLFLFLDYDGTLTPIVDSPERAIIDEDTLMLIRKLQGIMPVAIVTGRSLNNIMDIIKIGNLVYAGNHGAEIWDGNKLVIDQQIADSREMLNIMIAQLKATLSPIQGLIIEDKGITASIHFRMVSPHDICRVHDVFWAIAERHKEMFTITSGKKVFEIRPHGMWNKGDAVKWIWGNIGENRLPLYIGDDLTDEDAFKAIRGKGIGVSVEKSEEADYYMKTQDEVKAFLNWVLGNP